MKVKRQIHSKFKLQGKSFSSEIELINFTKNISSEVTNFLKQWFNNNSFVEIKTSGSTGKPKHIQLQKKFMINSAIATGEYFELPETTSALLCMSPNYIAGKMMLVRALTLGWHLDVVKPSSNPLKNCTRKYDFCAMVPLQLQNSLNDLSKIKKLIVGGGAVSEELILKIQNVPTEVFATYGMTESITHIAVKKLNNFLPVIASEMKQSVKKDDEITSSDGHLPNNVIASGTKQSVGSDAKITSGDGYLRNEVTASERKANYNILPNIKISKDNRGCLIIDAPNVSTEKIITNDLVEIISEKEFNWLGRFDTIINSGGIKIVPEQVEKKLSKLISDRFFVAGISDAILGEKVILIIEGFYKSTSKDELLKKIKNKSALSQFEVPKEIVFIERFIETETKKVNRPETLKLVNNSY